MTNNNPQIFLPYKQKFYNSCLISCALMATGVSKELHVVEEMERKIFFEAEAKSFPFSVQGTLVAITKNLDIKCRLIVDNAYFAKVLDAGLQEHPQVRIECKRISAGELRKEFSHNGQAVISVDGHILGDYAHWPHFVFVENATKNRFTFIDPNTAGRRYFSDEKMDQAIDSLRGHLKICPFMVVFKK